MKKQKHCAILLNMFKQMQSKMMSGWQVAYVYGFRGCVQEGIVEFLFLSPPLPPPQPGVCGCSDSSVPVGSYNAYHKLQWRRHGVTIANINMGKI